jgi:hypothetical protein
MMDNEIGYRGWYIDENATLLSVHERVEWKSQVIEAICSHGCEIAYCLEHHDCMCGIYSLSDLEKVVQTYPGFPVYGKIHNHGIVVVGEYGYRAEIAMIQELYTSDLILGEKLKAKYPGVHVSFPPATIVDVMHTWTHAPNTAQKWINIQNKRKALADKKAALELKYPGGFVAEYRRIQRLLKGKTRDELVEFAKTYAHSQEWADHSHVAKIENSRKAKPGEFVFLTRDTITPYIFVGSARHPYGQSSIRYLLAEGGNLVRKTNIRKWDEEAPLLKERQLAIQSWK